jgi:2-polyprenyl-3-methyl-5-hydroxy-6-metoxy-1,4-benzoquinol methylase
MSDNFNNIIRKINQESPFQKKKLNNYLQSMEQDFFDEAEIFASNYLDFLASNGVSIDLAVKSYLEMLKKMMHCQVEFMKTGKYSLSSSSQAEETVYNDPDKMTSYMFGLALSQFLWKTHYYIFKFFQQKLKENAKEIHSYLEIGPGHGLYLSKALEYLPESEKITAVDISSKSIELSKSILKHFHPQKASLIRYIVKDMLLLDIDEKYDFITMGEVMEHVDFPEILLQKVKNLLSVKGKSFISTCVNCPAVDHVYHFKAVDKIREMIYSCDLNILDEQVLPVENLPMEEIISKKITINYCALIN